MLYGDSAYGIARNIIPPFRGVNLPDKQQDFNSAMSKVRICRVGFWKDVYVTLHRKTYTRPYPLNGLT